jgi:ABC-type uncharacterized transport system ATPase subunit
MEDAVEKNIEGLAEQIIQEDSEKRAQELVSHCQFLYVRNLTMLLCRTCSISLLNEPTGT